MNLRRRELSLGTFVFSGWNVHYHSFPVLSVLLVYFKYIISDQLSLISLVFPIQRSRGMRPLSLLRRGTLTERSGNKMRPETLKPRRKTL